MTNKLTQGLAIERNVLYCTVYSTADYTVQYTIQYRTNVSLYKIISFTILYLGPWLLSWFCTVLYSTAHCTVHCIQCNMCNMLVFFIIEKDSVTNSSYSLFSDIPLVLKSLSMGKCKCDDIIRYQCMFVGMHILYIFIM